MKLNKLLMGVAAAGLLSLPGAASAQVTAWDYRVVANWENWTPVDGVIHETTGNEDILRWGTPTNGATEQSRLRVTRTIDSTTTTGDEFDPIITNGAGSPGATIIHDNNPLTVGPSLESTDLRIVATFTPAGNGGGDFGTITRVFDIDFEETLNERPCLPNSISVCDDIFILNNPSALERSFTIGDGFLYTATLYFGDFFGGQIFFDDIDNDGVSELYFLTQEGLESRLETIITITAEAIPEPGAFALIGAGLAGLGLTARRRRKA